MAFATFGDVIIMLVLRPQTITDGIGLELSEMEHTVFSTRSVSGFVPSER